MLRAFLRMTLPCLLFLGILIAAKYLDSGKFVRKDIVDQQQSVTVSVAEKTEATEAETVATTATIPTQTVPEETIPEDTVPAETEPEKKSFVFTFMGDCTFGGTPSMYYAQLGFMKTVGDDYSYPFEYIKAYLEEDDFTLLNLEGPLCDEGYPMQGNLIFHGEEAYVNILTQNSVDAVSLSNNHTMDYGAKGYDRTRKVLDDGNIHYVEKNSGKIIELENGLKIGLYATMYTDANKNVLVSGINSLKQQGADVIIYVPHWGVENSYSTTDEQVKLAHAAIDAGANIVFGSHPHVLQPIEEYKNGVIYYSAGNFSFGGNTNPGDMDTALLQQEIILLEDNTVQLGERNIVPCRISSDEKRNNYQPVPYESGSEEFARVMAKLSGTYSK